MELAGTLDSLHRSDYLSIPDVPGIYQIIVPQNMVIHFTDQITNSAARPYPISVLSEKYSKCIEKQVLYIGKASGKRGLRQRIRQYIKHGWNEAGNHKGGRAIWQIENCGLLLLQYEPCQDCVQREHQLLKEFRRRNTVYPLANWRC